MMFLPESKWSSRYEPQFYTIRMNSYIILDKPPSSGSDFGSNECTLCSRNTKLPAIYFKIEVLRGNTQHTCLRRYSQFLYLYNKIGNAGGELTNVRQLPPKTGPFHRDSPEFLEQRMKGLYKFLIDLLLRPECVNNPLVEAFLELNSNDEGL